MIEESVTILGEEYAGFIRAALRNRWVDRADNPGRAGGAFCCPIYGVHPYIFSTFTGSLYSTFILAHDLGHAAHMGLAARYQKLTNNRYANFFAEAPSTLGEHLLAQQVRRTSQDARLQRWVAMFRLNTYHHNFVTHLLEAELLRRLYSLAEAGSPSPRRCSTGPNAHPRRVLGRYGGDRRGRLAHLDAPAPLLHGSLSLHVRGGPHRIDGDLPDAAEEGEPVARRWVDVLKAGGTKKPLELFRIAGIDMSGPEPLRRAVAYVGGLIDEVERGFAGDI